MSAFFDSGVSTPTVVVSSPSSPRLKGRVESYAETIYNNPRIPASTVVEFVSSRPNTSSTVYIYDLAEQAGFGTVTKEWASSQVDTAPVVDLQTRAGAGLTLVGRLSEGTSQETVKGAVLTAYTTPAGLASMAPALAHLPPASPSSRLTIQVASLTSAGESLAFTPSLSTLASSWSLLSDNTAVLLSSTPQQTADFAALSYNLTKSHVIHVFDQYSSARELGHQIKPAISEVASESLQQAFSSAGYKFFDYVGDVNAQTVLVLLNGPLALSVASLVKKSSDVGVLIVNVLRPWDESAFVDALPSTATTLHVFDDVPNASTQGSLYVDVLGSTIVAKPSVTVREHRLVPTKTHELLSAAGALSQHLESILPSLVVGAAASSSSKKVLTFSNPENPLSQALRINEGLFFSKKGVIARSLSDFDGFSKQGGLAVNRLLLSSGLDTTPVSFALPLDAHAEGVADIVAVLDQALLKSHAVLQYAKQGSPVLVATNWTPEEFATSISSQALHTIRAKGLHVFTVNAEKAISKVPGLDDTARKLASSVLLHLVFVRLYLGKAATEDTVITLAQASLGAPPGEVSLKILNTLAWSALEEIVLPETSQEVVDNEQPLRTFSANAIAVDSETGETVINGARLASWHDAAKHILFPSIFTPEAEPTTEEYPQIPSLHPETPDRTFLVTCTVNRRLTPLEYDRNVFHLEFDTSGTGLKYAIGEALGVHGWNDEQEVLDFCQWYGVDPNKLVTIPIPGGEGKTHTRTVFQALQQQIDLFGHPPKSFYTDLAPYAASSVDRHALLFIGAAEGVATYKKLSEKDTVTFADILAKYTTARPPIEKLCELVGDIKPRHYSIASSQSVVGDRVDLLVVTVEWLTPSGSPRFGQCTRYLAGLKPGQKVTVSIKPSVMKLPPSPEQPIILAGLGTGAAPFRAFFQHLAWLKAQGQKIGPVYYYFGSRHQASEYLYGEEVEAFIQDGVITKAGLAFSRDGPKKVYIQHKMLEDSRELVDMLYDQKGVFYLCGPTWPVPDVYEALINSLVNYKGVEPTLAAEYLEGLKEEERYVLEVY